jgi:Cytochrome c, mono- and diheme variants
MKKIIVMALCFASCRQQVKKETDPWPASFGFGRIATQEEIARLHIDIHPDGKGLPVGEGNAKTGKSIYVAKCATCHGVGKEPDTLQLLGPMLITKNEKTKLKTIGNYWPYATTLFDYIRRAMPYNEPGSLTNDEVYHLTAYLLQANKVISENTVITEKTLATIKMPAHDRFIDDDRRGGNEVR